MSAGGFVLGDDSGTKRAGAAARSTGGDGDLGPDRLDQSHTALSQARRAIDVRPSAAFWVLMRIASDRLSAAGRCRAADHARRVSRPHLEYAVEKGVDVFMEKDFAADPGGIRMLRAGEAAEKKNLKIAAGLMCRHSSARQALIQKIRDGAMGEVQLIRAYRMDRGYSMGPFPRGQNELLWQLSRGIPSSSCGPRAAFSSS